MNNKNTLIERDLRHIWHPCAQMKDFERCPPIVINRARGSYLYTHRGKIIDGISSWWCKSLGHGHPAVIAAIKQQLDCFEHVIAANTTHHALAELGENLAEISGKQHVFFASDGASAVEIALKLSIHAQQQQGQAHRRSFIALNKGYHGETLATLSVSDLGLYKAPYQNLGVDCHFVAVEPYLIGVNDALDEPNETSWQQTLVQLDAIKETVAAIIVEPLIQGAAGMRCYSSYFLQQLATWAKNNSIYLIADEIMTGFGRTGQWFACDHAQVSPDMICVSKGLTSGSVPLSCVLIDNDIYKLFYHDYQQQKSFLHSHTYSGNALGVSAALATIRVMHDENINAKAQILGQYMKAQFQQVADSCGKLTNIRSLGAVVAGDFIVKNKTRIDQRFYQQALKRGALLRPLGHTLYWMPPLNTHLETIESLASITFDTIEAIL